MNKNQLPPVTFEQAKRLKELGFDWETRHYYFDEDEENRELEYGDEFDYNHGIYGYETTSAPTVALALKWMRDEINMHKIVTAHTGCFSTESYYMANGKEFDDYDAAESALLDELLTILEDKPF
jgi:hypothetical protein